MKLCSYTSSAGDGIGAVVEGGIVPLNAFANSMMQLIASWHDLSGAISAAVEAGRGMIATDRITLRAPITRPGKVLAIGLNYADHIAESGLPMPEHQLWFSKQPTSINGPFDPIDIPRVAPASVDYEAELVAVIGRAGRHISRSQAPEHVFGYCCGNDVSVREWQKMTPQWMLGKSFDTHAPIGPWLVTADEVGDPHTLGIVARVNGEIRQSSNTCHLVFDLWKQIEHLSKAMTLETNDLIFTGTPGGVGAAMKPPHFLAAGDIVTVEIERLGKIEAICRTEP